MREAGPRREDPRAIAYWHGLSFALYGSAKLVIPLHPALQAELALARRDHMSILTTAYHRQFSVKGFGNMVSEAIGKAGLPARCKAHGLRKAAARRLAEAGCTEIEIAAITGHKTLAEVERYPRAADQERLGRRAMQKQQENMKVANRPADVAKREPKIVMKQSLRYGLGAP